MSSRYRQSPPWGCGDHRLLKEELPPGTGESEAPGVEVRGFDTSGEVGGHGRDLFWEGGAGERTGRVGGRSRSFESYENYCWSRVTILSTGLGQRVGCAVLAMSYDGTNELSGEAGGFGVRLKERGRSGDPRCQALWAIQVHLQVFREKCMIGVDCQAAETLVVEAFLLGHQP
jgi:hypothetical protein